MLENKVSLCHPSLDYWCVKCCTKRENGTSPYCNLGRPPDGTRGCLGYQIIGGSIEKCELDQKDKNLLEGIILEKEFERLGGSNSQLARSGSSEEIASNSNIKHSFGFPEFDISDFTKKSFIISAYKINL